MSRFMRNSQERLSSCLNIAFLLDSVLSRLRLFADEAEEKRINDSFRLLTPLKYNLAAFMAKCGELNLPLAHKGLNKDDRAATQLNVGARRAQQGAMVAAALYDLVEIVKDCVPLAIVTDVQCQIVMDNGSTYVSALERYKLISNACATVAEQGFGLAEPILSTFKETAFCTVLGPNGHPLKTNLAIKYSPPKQGLVHLVNSAFAIAEHCNMLDFGNSQQKVAKGYANASRQHLNYTREELAKLDPIFGACEALFDIADTCSNCFALLDEEELSAALQTLVEIS